MLERPLEQSFFATSLAQSLSFETLRLNCFYLWLFRQIPDWEEGLEGDVVDVGSKNFFYAPALLQFLLEKNWKAGNLLGIEADANRLYRDFYTRGDYARYYCALSSRFFGRRVSFRPENFLEWSPERPVAAATCLFPFLYSDLSDKWGLPRSYFAPRRLYEKLKESASQILFFHQGEEECQESLKLIEKLGAGRVLQAGPFQQNPWVARRHPVYLILWKPSV